MSAPVLSWLLSVMPKIYSRETIYPTTACNHRRASGHNSIPKDRQIATAQLQKQNHSSTPPALRASPYPEVTDLTCRLPLSTLSYRPEASNLGDLMRLWVRSPVRIIHSPSDFQGSLRTHQTPRETKCFCGQTTLSRDNLIPG